ncbi:MAG TPA: helix-turn-helix domain-containing protein [Terriglobia bacterium]|nr:helix-turn-helix domain-containing protein [Terriglobia bacterium]
MAMIGVRIRQLREQKGLSQGDIEEKTGLLRTYISRVENGHTVPSLETLERFAGALDVPLYQFFYLGDGPPPPTQHLTPRRSLEELAEENGGTDAKFLVKLNTFLAQLAESDREVVLALAKRMAAEV